MRDSWRLAVGTFLAIPVAPPRRTDRAAARGAMVLAPLTTVPALAVWCTLAVTVAAGWLAPAHVGGAWTFIATTRSG